MTLLADHSIHPAARPAPLTGSGRASGIGGDGATLVDALLAEQRDLSAVERFARAHERHELPAREKHYRSLLPATAPSAGQQYAFEVDLDQCSGCKACVTACHSLNGLEDEETWRSVGLLVSQPSTLNSQPAQHHVTTACHHCADPGCLNGCPVLAYDKDPVTGIVRHLDDQCIGCQYCVMKCPYEVPKYSERLGIVRKCDMCANRLAVGEAPACVQACPNEAISITLVDQAKVRGAYRPLPSHAKQGRGERVKGSGVDSAPSLPFPLSPLLPFLPDSPSPAITLPTTRYRSANPKLAQLVAADHAALRLDPPHWPLVIMLVLTQAAAGLALLPVALALADAAVPTTLTIVTLALLLAGMGAAVLHLGQPLKAWRSFLGWRKSWLSRELIAFNLFAAVSSLAVAAPLYVSTRSTEPERLLSRPAATLSSIPNGGEGRGEEASGLMKSSGDRQTVLRTPPLLRTLSVLTAFVALLAVFASAMVYVDTQRPFWCVRITFGNFLGTTLLLGATFGAVIFGWRGNFAVAQPCVLAALFLRTALFAWRRLEWRGARRNAGSPIHSNARVIGELLASTQHANAVLFVASTAFGLLAIVNVGGNAAVWASLAAATTFSSEIIARYVFFTASSSRRMPGGVVA